MAVLETEQEESSLVTAVGVPVAVTRMVVSAGQGRAALMARVVRRASGVAAETRALGSGRGWKATLAAIGARSEVLTALQVAGVAEAAALGGVHTTHQYRIRQTSRRD